jgi:hypothetical protein
MMRQPTLFLTVGLPCTGKTTAARRIEIEQKAVEDVIWVERRPEGSSASWLSPAAREALVRQDVASGLLSLLS